MPRIHPIARWTAAFLFAILIFYLSSRPISGVPSIPHIDKAAHFVFYAVFSFLLIWSLRSTRMRSGFAILFLGASLATAYGMAMEVYQMSVPGRTPEMLDGFMNGAGAFAAAFLCSKIIFDRHKEGSR